jgi:hypothetical protein
MVFVVDGDDGVVDGDDSVVDGDDGVVSAACGTVVAVVEVVVVNTSPQVRYRKQHVVVGAAWGTRRRSPPVTRSRCREERARMCCERAVGWHLPYRLCA